MYKRGRGSEEECLHDVYARNPAMHEYKWMSTQDKQSMSIVALVKRAYLTMHVLCALTELFFPQLMMIESDDFQIDVSQVYQTPRSKRQFKKAFLSYIKG